MLSNVYKEVELRQRLRSSIKEANKSSFIDFFSFTAQEYSEYEQKMKRIFSKATGPIPFKVSDLLRGKCVFSSVERINKCCADIKEEVRRREGEGLRLIEVDNRLAKGNSDLVLKVLFGSTIAELQLVKDLNTADYEFSHKLYELQRSQFFTPLTQLSLLNEDLSKDYLTEVRALILHNIDRADDYKEKVTFRECMESFKAFARKLEVRMNFMETHVNEIDVAAMSEEQRRLAEIVKARGRAEKRV